MYFHALKRSKLGDLGSATGKARNNPALDEGRANHLGDMLYAPPECLYGYQAPEWSERFQAIDLYLLGQLTLYFLTFENMTARVIKKLPPNYRPQTRSGSWRGDFAAILPHLEGAYEEVLTEVRADLTAVAGDDFGTEVTRLIGYLCHPDPARRGHPRNRDPLSSEGRFGLNRFVSRFDIMAKKAGRLTWTKP